MDELPTRVPATVDALFTRLEAAFTGDGVLVLDGPVTGSDIPDDVLVIGHPGGDGVSVSNDVTRVQGLGHRYAETFEIRCCFSSRTGSTNMKARRDRCYWALGIVEDALKQDRGLGGVVDLAGLGPSMQWGQEQHPDGATCDVVFSVVGKATL